MLTATKAGRYEILGELGRGGMGVVYRARDPLIGRTVAVKTVRLSEEGTGMSHAQLVERFQTEARAAGLLTHPNIVVIYDAGETDGLYYITMELVNGKSLQSLLDSGEKFPLPRLLRIMEQVCAALQFAHDHNVVHRDIKPANIMLAADDLVKITDFGTAKILQYGASQQTSAMGTPGYMSPEQIRGKAVDGRTDIFSLGVMLYEMTTGQRPFRGQDVAAILYRILNEDPPPPQKLNPSLPLGVSSTILKAMAKSPHLRYENCRELLEDLKNYRPGESGAAANAASHLSAPPPVRESFVRDVKKNFKAEMPQIPGVEARPTPPPPPSSDAAANDAVAEVMQVAGGIYAGPTTKLDLAAIAKRLAKIAAGIVLVAMLGSFVIKTIGRANQADSDAPPARQDNIPSAQPPGAQTQTDPDTDSAQRPLYVSQSNPELATVSELAQPWSSKRFFFRSLTLSKNVPALIIRLPGPASEGKSYWAFSLEAPFSQCQFVYLDDLAKLSSEYGFQAVHPMVVNPCSHAIFDPLQLKELPGNILVRGAIVHGYDPRPPYGIEVRVSDNQVLALAME
jgi:eukaryotic-like serine/threonine-protein kinase